MDQIKIILIDVDGVLTDGKFWVSSTGERMKGFNTRDIRAIKELISHGYEVYLVTASTWEGIQSYCSKVGAIPLVARDKTNAAAMFENYIAIGDDAWDIKLLKNADIKYCPADADESVKSIYGIKILNTNGGDGCIAELAKILLNQSQLKQTA